MFASRLTSRRSRGSVTGGAVDEPWTPERGPAPWISSIGHSDHDLDVFFGLVHDHDVSVLVDVRSHPRSFVEHFSKPDLAESCRARGVTYHHVPSLGGMRDVPYPQHMGSAAWARGYDRLRELAWQAVHDGKRAAFMCVERDPGECHRRFIARRLEADGWRVHHVLPDGGQTRLF